MEERAPGGGVNKRSRTERAGQHVQLHVNEQLFHRGAVVWWDTGMATDAGGHSPWQQGGRTPSPSQLVQRTWPSSPRGSVPARHAFVHVVEQRSDSASRRAWTQAPSGGQTEQWLNPTPRTLSTILREAWNQAPGDTSSEDRHNLT